MSGNNLAYKISLYIFIGRIKIIDKIMTVNRLIIINWAEILLLLREIKINKGILYRLIKKG